MTAAKCIIGARKKFQLWEKKQEEIMKFTTTRAPQNWRAFLQKFDDFNRLHVDQNGYGITPAPISETIPEKWWKSEDEEVIETTTTSIPTTTTTHIPEATTFEARRQFSYEIHSKPTIQQKQVFQSSAGLFGSIPIQKINSNIPRQRAEAKDPFIPARRLFHYKSKSPEEYSTDYSTEYKPLKQVKIPLIPKKDRLSRFQSMSHRLAQQYPMYYQPKALPYSPYYRRWDTSRRFEKLRHRVKRHMRFSDSKKHYYKEHFFNVKSQSHLKGIKSTGEGYSEKVSFVFTT